MKLIKPMVADKLFQPLTLGSTTLRNRVVMAPMTRSRAEDNGCANSLMQQYYQQRAQAGLIITEGVYPDITGKGYNRTPGIANSEQAKTWRAIVDAVHSEGGKISMQLMHCGRIAHPDNRHEKADIVAPSAIAAKGRIFTPSGMQRFLEPTRLTPENIERTILSYQQATERALDCGFDLVELHCTSGYLPAQFLSTGTNKRHDHYGGNLENRLRFVIDVIKAMAAVDGAKRIGIRICPGNRFNDLDDDNPKETFSALLKALSVHKLAYLHAMLSPDKTIDVIDMANSHFSDRLILNGLSDKAAIEAVLLNGAAAAISFGRAFIANADFVKRLKNDSPLTPYNPKTLYTKGAVGYTDY